MTWFLLDGINPEPWEAPEGAVVRPKGKKPFVQFHKTARSRAYQTAIQDEFKRQYPDVEPFDFECSVTFFFWRTLDAPRARKVDATNLQKSTEDALQGLLYVNDVLVTHVESFIMAQEPDADSKIIIWINPVSSPPIHIDSIVDQLLIAQKSKPDQNLRTLSPEEVF